MLNGDNYLKPRGLDLDATDRSQLIEQLVTGQAARGSTNFFRWKLLKSFPLDQIGGQAAIAVTLGHGGFLDWDSSETLVMVWRSAGDDKADYQKATEAVDIEEGETAVFKITERRGDVLELWCTDDLPITIDVQPLALANKLLDDARVRAAAVAKEKAANSFFAGKLDVNATIWKVAAIAVIGLVVYGVVVTPGAARNLAGAV